MKKKSEPNIGEMNTEAFAYEKEKAWFVHSQYNALFEADLQSGKCKCLGFIPEEELCLPTLYVNIKKYGKYLVMAPFMANDIAIYDIKKRKFIKIKLKDYNNLYIAEKFSDLVIYKEKVFFIPMTYPAIIILDMNTFQLEYLENIVKDAEVRRLNPKYIFNIKPVKQGEILWLGCFATNYIVEFHMETYKYIYHEIEECKKGMSGIDYRENTFWIIQYPQYKVISWNLENNKENVYDKFPFKFEGGKYPFSNIVCEKKRILFLPEQANMLLVLNPENGMFEGKIREKIRKMSKIEYSTYFGCEGEHFYIKSNGTIVKIKEDLGEEIVCELRLSLPDLDILYGMLISMELKKRKNYNEPLDENILGKSALVNYLEMIVESEKIWL